MIGFRLGLTGSIGMGKSTTASFFRAQGVPVWDADDVVHRLYAVQGAAVDPMRRIAAPAIIAGAVDRPALKALIAADPSLLTAIEAVVHPLVAQDRSQFLSTATTGIVVLDIPLLFETGTDADMDATLLVTAPPALQRARVLARPGMTEAGFKAILARQMPDAEKRARATHIIETLGLAAADHAVRALLHHLRTCHA